MNNETKEKLKKISKYLQNTDDTVTFEMYTSQKYEYENTLAAAVDGNYVNITRRGFYNDSFWDYEFEPKSLKDGIDYALEENDISSFNNFILEFFDDYDFKSSGDDDYEFQDEIDSHDFDEIPEELLDEDGEDIDIEKLQDNYDFDLIEEEGGISKFDSLSIDIGDEKITIDWNI
jgi:hypothetical protein|tara:strand:- start:47 stop:571 length:525 start_codon:yes stop_codon:yes gene_type:complete